MIDTHVHGPVTDGWGTGPVREALWAGTHPGCWKAQLAARRTRGVHLAMGLHPWWVAEFAPDPAALARCLALLELALDEAGRAAVALGEVGLDAGGEHRRSLLAQEHALRRQLELSARRELPLVVHSVRAHGRLLELLAEAGPMPAGGVVHGFSGAPQVAARFVALGFHIGLGPIVANPEAKRARATAESLPLDRLLLETDAAGLGTHGETTLRQVAGAVSELRGESLEALTAASDANARRLFQLDRSP